MIVGACNRVPPSGHWDLYRRAAEQDAALLGSLSAAIEDYVEDYLESHEGDDVEIKSSKACTAVLRKWPDARRWREKFGSDSRGLFGMVMWVFFYDDHRWWETDGGDGGGRSSRVYWPVPRD